MQALIQESCYGSAIMERLSEATNAKLTLHSGSVYPALIAMEEEGLIRRKKIASENGHGRACFYELTRQGRAVAREHREIVDAVFFTSAQEKAEEDP